MEQPDLWHCDHERTEYRTYTKTNGVGVVVVQCLRCGAKPREVGKNSSEVTAAVAARGTLAPYDDLIRLNWEAGRERLWRQRQVAVEAEKQQRDADWWARYHAHLNSPKWSDLRRLVLKRANYQCEGCGISIASEAHHETYEHLGDEFLFELRALCTACHLRLHGRSA
jgi:5-methylcytosine-specific restriction endonuclease McrA